MKNKAITPEDLFFSDESIFPLKAYLIKEQIKLDYAKNTKKNKIRR